MNDPLMWVLTSGGFIAGIVMATRHYRSHARWRRVRKEGGRGRQAAELGVMGLGVIFGIGSQAKRNMKIKK